MLNLTDPSVHKSCAGLSRREVLRIGALGLGGLTLPDLLRAREEVATAGGSVRDVSVVLLFLQGGPSHIEFFDPKMEAPLEIRSTTGEVPTKLPGITFGGTFPKLGKLADRLAIVRSYQSKNGGHTYQDVVSARNPLKATMSALYSRAAGTSNPNTGIPSNTLILPEAIKPDLKLRGNFEKNALPGLTSAGSLGSTYAAFNPVGGGAARENMELRLPQSRFSSRRNLLSALDGWRRNVEESGKLDGIDRYRGQAYDILLRGVGNAFDLSKEDPKTIERYDTSKLFDMKVLNRYNDMYRSSNLLGLQLLMARRLCEAGCGFVTVADAGWDMHGNNNSLPRLTGMKPLGNQVDHAVSAFLEDVEERGLSEKILLVITGEMGRSPKINGRGGRDHYGNMTSLCFAGGGLNMGQVIGRSDSQCAHPATEAYGPENLLATVMHTLFDTTAMRLRTDVPSTVSGLITDGHPIPGLL